MDHHKEHITRKDLADDFEEQLFLAYSLFIKLTSFEKKLKNHGITSFITLKQQVIDLVENIKHIRTNTKHLPCESLIETKRQQNVSIRVLSGAVAGMITSNEWQSPSYNHSLYAEAGLMNGEVTGNITDYTRDQLISGNEYQRRFGNEFIGSWRTLPIQPLLTQSGMASLTTILVFLLKKGQFTRPVLLGKHCYFQNKELVTGMVPQQVIEVDEHDTNQIIKMIKKHAPSAIFLDTICNAPNLAAPDLKTIFKHLFIEAHDETYLVIDNTCAGPGFDVLKLLFPFRGKVKLLAFESLNKYYQYGMDKTIGGFCWGLPQDAGKLFYARLHAGTIMNDWSTALLPPPNMALLLKRLRRIERNALILAQELEVGITKESKIDRVWYPKLPSHPAYPYAKRYAFGGGSVTVSLKPTYRKVKTYKHIVNNVIKAAKNAKIPLVAGSSFGLQTTRIYVTAANAEKGEPFLRISPGTETDGELAPLHSLISKVIEAA
jgi:cystathionine beta-lyase/cystathionine gamma-synthase